MLGTESVAVISHRTKPLSSVNAARVQGGLGNSSGGDHSNKMISVMNAGGGKTEKDACFQNNRCATFDKLPKSPHYVFLTKLRKVEADTAGERRGGEKNEKKKEKK